MKKSTITIKGLSAAVLLSLVLLNAGSLRCESRPEGLSNAQPQAKIDRQGLTKTYDQDRQEDKSQRFKELEWVIMQNLINKYQKLEIGADQGEDLD